MEVILCILAILGCATAQFGPTTKQHIVNAHNTLRSDIAKGTYNPYVNLAETKKPATNMRKIKWSTTLETSAQAQAEKCPEDGSAPSRYGESLFVDQSSTGETPLNIFGGRATDRWENEFINYGWISNKMDDETLSSGIKEAAQMAWADTDSVGCGVKLCQKDQSTNLFQYLVVCHYDKPGNQKDANIYEEGPTCSACSNGFKCNTATGLCKDISI